MRIPLFLTILLLNSMLFLAIPGVENNPQSPVELSLDLSTKQGYALDLSEEDKARSASADSIERILVLLIEPSDAWHWPGDGKDYIDELLFDESSNSMAKYYDENSRGQTSVSGYVTDWIDISRTISGCDEESSTGAYLTDDCIEEAIRNVDSSIDFSYYDQNNDGYVDNLMAVFNAPDESQGESWYTASGAIWPHASGGSISTNDGVVVNNWFVCTYSCPLGTFVHEFAHNLGLPDLYDVDYSSSGIGDWGVMGSGGYLTYNGDYNPGHFSAWSKVELGWVEPIIVQPSDTASFTLYPSNDWGNILKVPIGGGEYFLIEYRDKTASYYDRALPASGILIWHIDDGECFDGYNRDNAEDWHPCVRLVQADDADELQYGWDRGDSSDVFGDNRNFNDQSSPPARLYDGSKSGLQFTVIDVNSGSDYAEVHFGEFTSWFYRMTATPGDSNGDGFNNEILFEYDPDTDGSNVDIQVEFEFYSTDRQSFVNSFEYNHTIDGNDFDSFEQDIGYYSPGKNGMFWVEAYLWSEGNLCETVVFGNLWIEYPVSGNTEDESIEDVVWEMRDTIGDGYNDSVRVHYDLTTTGFAEVGDINLRIYSQENVSNSVSAYQSSLDVNNGSMGYIDLALWDTELEPGRLSGQLTLYVDGYREAVVSTTTLEAYWESLRIEDISIESIDFDLDGNPDTLSLNLDIEHSYRDENFVTLEINFWDPNDFNGEPPIQWVFSHRVDGLGESRGGRGIFQWDLHSDTYVPLGYLEIRVLYPDGREKSTWVYSDDDYNDLTLYPLDWPVDLFSHSVIELDNDVDGVSDALRVVYDLDTTAAALDVLVELEVEGPDYTMSIWSNVTLNGSQLDSDYIDIAAWEPGTYTLTLKVTDTTDSTTPINMVIGTYELQLAGGAPSIELNLDASDFLLVGDLCLIETEVQDMASGFYELSPIIDWQGTAGTIPMGQSIVNCTGWPAGNYDVQVDYISQFGNSDSDNIIFTINQPENPEISLQVTGNGDEVGESCSIVVQATAYGLVIPSSDIHWLGIPSGANEFGTVQDCTNWKSGNYLVSVVAIANGLTETEQSLNLIRIPTIDSAENSDSVQGQETTRSGGDDVETGQGTSITMLIGFVLLVIPLVFVVIIMRTGGSKRHGSEFEFEDPNMMFNTNENAFFGANPNPSTFSSSPALAPQQIDPQTHGFYPEPQSQYSPSGDINHVNYMPTSFSSPPVLTPQQIDPQTHGFYPEAQSQYSPSGDINHVNSIPAYPPLNVPPPQSQLKEIVDSEGYHWREYPDGRLEWYDSQIGEWSLFEQ